MTVTTPPPAGSEPVPEGLRPPLAPRLARLLRLAAWEHAVGTRQRVLVPQLHVGLPGEPHPVIAATAPDGRGEPCEPWDHALRSDALTAMRTECGKHALVWLVRTGPREPHDLDLLWLAAARQAFAERAEPLVFVIVDRHGWWDPRSGLQRTWVRLRKR